MGKSCHSKDGSHVDLKAPQNVSSEGNQSLTTETLQNLNQFLVTQTQLMQRLIQRMDANNAPLAPVSATPEERSGEELPKDKPLEVTHNEEVSCSLPEGRHLWKFVPCFRCGEQGHFAYECPQKEKSMQEIHCAGCNLIGHCFRKCPRKKDAQFQVCFCCGKEGHFVKQCPSQMLVAPQAPSVPKSRSKEPEASPRAAIICSSSEGREFLKTSLTSAAQHQSVSNQVTPGRTVKHRTSPKALTLQAPCPHQGSGHKRKVEDHVQDIAKTSTTRIVVGPSLQGKTSKAKIQCFECSDLGHYANRCPRRRQTIAPDDLPEVTLIATITPAAGRKANAKMMSQVQEYRSLGLPMPQDETVKHQAGPSTSRLSAQGQPQKKLPPIASVTCFYCKELGHYANKCPKKQQTMKLASKQWFPSKALCYHPYSF